MQLIQKNKWFIAIISLFALFSSFFIFMNETQQLFSSLFAALLVTVLVFFSFVIFRWIYQAFRK